MNQTQREREREQFKEERLDFSLFSGLGGKSHVVLLEIIEKWVISMVLGTKNSKFQV